MPLAYGANMKRNVEIPVINGLYFGKESKMPYRHEAGMYQLANPNVFHLFLTDIAAFDASGVCTRAGWQEFPSLAQYGMLSTFCADDIWAAYELVRNKVDTDRSEYVISYAQVLRASQPNFIPSLHGPWYGSSGLSQYCADPEKYNGKTLTEIFNGINGSHIGVQAFSIFRKVLVGVQYDSAIC
jgi:hypothetical protein